MSAPLSVDDAIFAIAFIASRADGSRADAEEVALRAAAERLGIASAETLALRVALGEVSLDSLVARLETDEQRRAAYETAVAVCDADGPRGDGEADFLESLRVRLGVDAATANATSEHARAVADAVGALPRADATGAASATAAASGTPASGTLASGTGASGTGALDDVILRQSILAAALELLPDKLANIAILPLQLRLVYRVGQRHGQSLDAAQVKDLSATLGIGAAAQVMEGVVRKVLGGLLGRGVGGVGGLAAGAAVTFAATYALGHVADRYYSQGRRLSREDLKELYVRFQSEAQTIFPRVESEIRSQATQLDPARLLATLRGS